MLTAAAWMLALIMALPLTVFAAELLVGLGPGGKKPAVANGSIAVLIPAHDEAAGIAETLRLLDDVAPPGTRVLVVADNCSDATAAMARNAGAEVVERTDAARRGKGYALAFGRDRLAASATPPEVVLVLDADCRLQPGSIEALADAALRHATPAQAVNLIEADLTQPPMVQISSFAMLVKNLYRSRGMQRMGGAALLTGTGMAFPWPLFAKARLATGSIVEDLALGIEMTRMGRAPVLVEGAGVRSAPADIRDALAQRTRWEHGFLDTLRSHALPVVAKGVLRGSPAEVLLGLHLLVPPLALLLLIASAALAIIAGLTLLGADPRPAMALTGILAIALMLVLAAWIVGGRRFLTAGALARAPLYILWKLPVYAGFARKPQVRWSRTPRRP